MRVRWVGAGVVSLSLLAIPFSDAALARPSGPTKREIAQNACYDDAMRLCGQFVPDEAKITACMQASKNQLSPRCAALFEED